MSYTVSKDFIKKETLALKAILKKEGLEDLLKQQKQTKRKVKNDRKRKIKSYKA